MAANEAESLGVSIAREDEVVGGDVVVVEVVDGDVGDGGGLVVSGAAFSVMDAEPSSGAAPTFGLSRGLSGELPPSTSPVGRGASADVRGMAGIFESEGSSRITTRRDDSRTTWTPTRVPAP
jgi:hypothetical protein